ncbi:protein-tyrosine-phosphatase [Balamuthia mandrillaris]
MKGAAKKAKGGGGGGGKGKAKQTGGASRDGGGGGQQQQGGRSPQRRKPLKIPRELPEDHMAAGITMRGPTDYSNWIVKGHLMVGAFPKKQHMIEALLKGGITAFVCLMEEHEMHKHSKHYLEVAQDLIAKRPSEYPQSASALKYLHCPIPDRQVCEDETVSKFITQILGLLSAGEVVYVHCYGGHGRAGVFASILLGKIYNIPADKALELCKRYHDVRPTVEGISPKTVPSPQTHEQRTQVQRLLS